MLFDKHILPLPFKNWIIKDRENRILIILSMLAAFVLFRIFLFIYPHPNFLPDSYSYLSAATENSNINIWPIGYSKFLRFISVFNYTDTALFFIQYFLLQISLLFFVLTIKYILNPGKWIIRILLFLLILNPLWLYVSHFVSSDAVFAAFSILWLTTLFWLLYNPGKDLLLIHGLILFFVFSVRYNALYYPVLTVLVLLLNKISIKKRLFNISFALLPVILFISYTTWLYKEKTDTVQFTAFGGWQLAANALYMYSNIPTKETLSPPKKFKVLHNIATKHIDSLQKLKPSQRPDQQLGFYYLWGEGAPLKSYLSERYKKDSTTSYFKRWVKMAPLYSQYGSWLIKQYPKEYIQYFLLPNLINYYSPPVEFLGIYNMGTDSVDLGAVEWFKYKNRKVKSYYKNKVIIVTSTFQVILPIINVIFFSGFLGFVFLGGFRKEGSPFNKILYILIIIWLSNLGFSVLASPIVLRYQVFPFVYTLTFGVVLLAYVIRASFENTEKNKVSESSPVVTVI